MEIVDNAHPTFYLTTYLTTGIKSHPNGRAHTVDRQKYEGIARNHTEDGSILGTAHSSEMYRQNIGSHTHRKFLQYGLFSYDI
jgi:hypothetical protein